MQLSSEFRRVAAALGRVPESGRVDQTQGPATHVDHGFDGVAGRPRDIGDDGTPSPHKRVEQGGLARIGHTGQYDEHTLADGRKITVAVLIREEDWRPLNASWWRKKEVCIIGADLDGNFILRHSDGSVGLWDHKAQADSVLAPGVRQFAQQLTESELNAA